MRMHYLNQKEKRNRKRAEAQEKRREKNAKYVKGDKKEKEFMEGWKGDAMRGGAETERARGVQECPEWKK